MEKYYTQEQLEALAKRGELLGQEKIEQAQRVWPKLIAEVRAEMEKGSDPASEKVWALALRWKGLVEEFTGGDPGITASLRRMYREEPEFVAHRGYSFDPKLTEYVGQALAKREP